jgi:hypothetical protein
MKVGNRIGNRAFQALAAGMVLALGACSSAAQPPSGPRRLDRADPPSSAPGIRPRALGQASGNVIPPPPGIDPGIHAPMPPPDQTPMPVIPPPGAPGGDQRVVPR